MEEFLRDDRGGPLYGVHKVGCQPARESQEFLHIIGDHIENISMEPKCVLQWMKAFK